MAAINLRAIVRHPAFYVAAFLALFTAFYTVYQLSQPILPVYYKALADATCWALGWFDPAVSCSDNFILYNGLRELVVVEGCDGITFLALVAAAVLPFPAPWKTKVVGLAVLLPGVLLVNWLRLVVLAAIRFYLPGGFDLFHIYVFQPLMIGLTLMIFLMWIATTEQRVDGG
jgi:exosortase/archaeosortase family protein